MELDITEFFNKSTPFDYSASALEQGENTAPITWGNACWDAGKWSLLDTEEKLDAFRAFVKESGGWTDAEVDAFTPIELNALCIQWIAGDMREPVGFDMGPHMDSEDWYEYREQSREGQVAGRIFMGMDHRIYWSMG